jgi:hypothetical protein
MGARFFSFRVDQPPSLITLAMRLATVSAVRGPQRFAADHLRCVVREAGKPTDVIGDGDADAPLTEMRYRRAITGRANPAAGIDAKTTQLTPLAKAENTVVFEIGPVELTALLLQAHRG